MGRVEALDARAKERADIAPSLRDESAEDRQPDAGPKAPCPKERPAGDAELEHRDPPAGLHDARQLAHRRGGVVDVAQEIGEGEMVEGLVGEWQPFGARANERHVAVAFDRGAEHVRALIDANDTAAIAAAELARDHPRAGRDVEHDVGGCRGDRGDERVAPARILAEREDRSDAVVGVGDAAEDARGVGGRSRRHATYARTARRGSSPGAIRHPER